MEDCNITSCGVTSLENLSSAIHLKIAIHASFILVALVILIILRFCTKLRYSDHKLLFKYPWHNFKWTICMTLFVVILFSLMEGVVTDTSRNIESNPYLYIPQVMALLGVITSLVYYHHMECWNRPHLVWWLLLYWIMAFIGELIVEVRLSQYDAFNSNIVRHNIAVIIMVVHLSCVATEINILRNKVFHRHPIKTPVPDLRKPDMYLRESYTNLPSYLTAWWANWLILLGNKRQLEVNDLGSLPDEYECETVTQQFNKIYTVEQERAQAFNRIVSLWKTLFLVFGRHIAYSIVLLLLSSAISLIPPLAVSGVVIYATRYYYQMKIEYNTTLVTVDEFFGNGFILVITIGLCYFAAFLLFLESWRLGLNTSVKARSAIQMVIYEKSLQLTHSSISSNDTTFEAIINHVSVGTIAVQLFLQRFAMIICMPITTIVASGLVIWKVGVAGVIGICVLIISTPLLFAIMKKQREKHRNIWTLANTRLKKINELFLDIKLIKMCGWEIFISSDIEAIRNQEMEELWLIGLLYIVSACIAQSLPVIVSFVIFAVYSKLYLTPLTPDVVFSTLALSNLIVYSLLVITYTAGTFVEGLASNKRLALFLSLNELECYDQSFSDSSVEKSSDIDDTYENIELPGGMNMGERSPFKNKNKPFNYKTTDSMKTSLFSSSAEDVNSNVAIQIVNADFTWNKSQLPVLKNVNLEFPRGDLTVIIGKDGSGKETLIFAVLGELSTLTGLVVFNGKTRRMSYVARKAWIQNATVRENIIFGEAFDPARYYAVLGLCALNQDLDIMTEGDLTEIGEKETHLSQGQKQRISLARAVYSKTDIIVMNEPFSALQPQADTNVMVKAIIDFSLDEDRTIIYATHDVQHLEYAKKVVIMEDRRITHQGNLSKIRRNDTELYKQWQASITAISKSENESSSERAADKGYTHSSLSTTENDLMEAHIEMITQFEATLIPEEEHHLVHVSNHSIVSYAKAMKIPLVMVLMLIFLLQIAANVSSNLWLSEWAQYEQNGAHNIVTKDEDIRMLYLMIYGSIVGVFVIFTMMMNGCQVIGSISVAKRLFRKMLHRTIYAPMRFYETTPVGRILNRFAHDTVAVDLKLWITVNVTLSLIMPLVSLIIVNSVANLYFLIVVPVGLLLLYAMRHFGLTIPRQLRHLDTITKSSVYLQLTETIGGLTTIRAYRAQNRFRKRMEHHVDQNSLCQLYMFVSFQWLMCGVNLIAILVVLFSGFGTLVASVYGSLEPSLVGVSVSTSLSVCGLLSFVMFQAIDSKSYMNSVDRVMSYTKNEKEIYPGDIVPPSDWPNKGSIYMNNVSSRYADNVDPVLRNINIHLKSGQKIAVCGLTGSGKSSLILTLLRIIDIIEGSVIIDGIDISKVSIWTLRNRISIIPQYPVLFTGTIRFNLDPEGRHTNQELWRSLEIVELEDMVRNIDGQLDAIVTEGGLNFGAGQRKLFHLARTFLRKSNILVIDEAAASSDIQTDGCLQKIISSVFAGKTVLTIARSISTILNSDIVLVLRNGSVAEYDTPTNLLKKDDTIFSFLMRHND